ncbi:MULTISPECIES: hypothetical protein [Roseovarius]|jgi:hypothetical protein|uniref:hypothetical protein n=1 Tax=Roseovarius TaxID=74030 RepID=UPI00273E2A9A|nr:MULTISPECIES: hypothetical protein [unclassified Roseovarius]
MWIGDGQVAHLKRSVLEVRDAEGEKIPADRAAYRAAPPIVSAGSGPGDFSIIAVVLRKARIKPVDVCGHALERHAEKSLEPAQGGPEAWVGVMIVHLP